MVISIGLCSCSATSSSHVPLTGITKAGYLLKQTSASLDEWSRYFFALNGHSIAYCPSSTGFSSPEGDILLTSSTKIHHVGDDVSLRIETGYEVLLVRSKNSLEASEWKKAIEVNVAQIGDLARGYFIKLKRWEKKRYFFMLHRESITYHPSHTATMVISGIFPLTETTTATPVGARGIIINSSLGRKKRWKLVAESPTQQQNWLEALAHITSGLKAKEAFFSMQNHPISGLDCSLYSSNLAWRSSSGQWIGLFFALNSDGLYCYKSSKEDVKRFAITPNTTVFSTILNDFSFEVVTFSDVLHFNARSQEEKEEWIAALNDFVSSKCKYRDDDPLQEAALRKECTFYDVEFDSAESPGLVLERRGSWAVVTRVTNSLRDSVSVGSCLVAINEEAVVLKPYERVVEELSAWKPPLNLRFRATPMKRGWLKVLVTDSDEDLATPKNKEHQPLVWERKFVQLRVGKIILCSDNDNESDEAIHLDGAATALLLPKDVDNHRLCFRIMSGLNFLILQASSYDEMMDWASSIVHGISIEQGGGFLLHREAESMTRCWGENSDGMTVEDGGGFHSDIIGGVSCGHVKDKVTKEFDSTAVAEKHDGTGLGLSTQYTSRPANKTMLAEVPVSPKPLGPRSPETSISVKSADTHGSASLLQIDSFPSSDSGDFDDEWSEAFASLNATSPDNDSLQTAVDSEQSWARAKQHSNNTGSQDTNGVSLSAQNFASQEANYYVKDKIRAFETSAKNWTPGCEVGFKRDSTPLSDREIERIYAEISQGGFVNPLGFSKLVRNAKGGRTTAGNPFEEMTLFSKFSKDGRGVLCKDDFIRGLRRIERDEGVMSDFYQGLVQHVRKAQRRDANNR